MTITEHLTFAPLDTEPHALVRGIAPGVCTTCEHVVRIGTDPVHSIPGACERCAQPTRPLSTLCDPCHEAITLENEQARAKRLAGYGVRKPEAIYAEDDDAVTVRGRVVSAPDMSPAAVAERAARKRDQAEALEYVKAYTGSWGLPLDIRADPRFGTAKHRLSVGQVAALLAGKARDAQRAAQANDPRQVAARDWLKANPPRGEGFLSSMHDRAVNGLSFSEKQLEIVERIIAERSPSTSTCPAPACTLPAGHEDAHRAGVDVRRTVGEGWYVVDGIVWKVQRAVNGSGNLYGKQLVIDAVREAHWDYVPGGLRVIAERGEALSVEQAAAFGKLYGVCVVCGRVLTDETSISLGIGPVCRGRLS